MSTTFALRKVTIYYMDSLAVNFIFTVDHATLGIFVIGRVAADNRSCRYFAHHGNAVMTFLTMDIYRITHLGNRLERELFVAYLYFLQANYIRGMLVNNRLQLMQPSAQSIDIK